MNDRSKVVLGAVLGSLAGAAAATLWLTDSGRERLARMDEAFDELTGAIERFRGTIQRAAAAVDESRALVGDVKATVRAHGRARGPREVV